MLPWNALAHVGAFAVLGTFVRLVLQNATPPNFVPYLSSQFIGTLALGFARAQREHWNADIFLGISVGFCGSLTTFSTWQGEITSQLFRNDTLGNALAYQYIQDQVIGLTLAYCALPFGQMLGISVPMSKLVFKFRAGEEEESWKQVFALLVMLCACMGVVLGAVFAPNAQTFALCFAPFGAWLRFALAKALNRENAWPRGTLAANLLGTAIWGAIWDVQHYAGVVSTWYYCDVLLAIQDGFCGTLTTVSTLVLELRLLSIQQSQGQAALYGFTSILLAQLALMLIMGPLGWQYQQGEWRCND